VSASSIVRYLLANNAPLVAVVPATRIKVGNIRQGDTLPAISVKKISGDPQNTLAMVGAPYVIFQRIQVSLAVPHGQAVPNIWALIRAALPPKPGTVNSFTVDAIVPESEGPDLEDRQMVTDSSSVDYMVSFFR
jgi:hypothetical protein